MFNYQRFYFPTANIQLFFYLFITCTSFFITYFIIIVSFLLIYKLANQPIKKVVTSQQRLFLIKTKNYEKN